MIEYATNENGVVELKAIPGQIDRRGYTEWIVPDYDAGTIDLGVLGTQNSQVTKTIENYGFIKVYTGADNSSYIHRGYINDVEVMQSNYQSSGPWQGPSGPWPVMPGDVIKSNGCVWYFIQPKKIMVPDSAFTSIE